MVTSAFWSWQFVGAMVLNALIQAILVGAFAARIAGVRTKRIAISISLFTLFATASRTMNMFYAPLLGTISDRTGNAVVAAIHAGSAALAAPQVNQFEWQLRLIIFAGTGGALLGAALMPVYEHGYVRGVNAFQRLDSVPRALFRLTDRRVLGDLVRAFRVPNPAGWGRYAPSMVPLKLLVWNTVLQATYAVGVVAALYASVREPALARTSTLLSGIVNGIGTISFALFVDPTSAGIVDEAVHGKRTIEHVRAMVFWLIVTTVIGMLVSQLILVPATLLIEWAARLVHR
jgi:hypothetical protein